MHEKVFSKGNEIGRRGVYINELDVITAKKTSMINFYIMSNLPPAPMTHMKKTIVATK
jgi:hypothetical protein